MFGWEFPPYKSGGLGTACFGLTKGLASQNVDVTFVMPVAPDSEKTDFVKLIGANNLAKKISNEELLTVDCAVLVPAALSGVITAKNAGKIKARIVLELANGPTTPEADEILHKNKILVLPDVLANSGGVTVSYFEWVQNNYGYYWDEHTVKSRLKEKMVSAFDKIWKEYAPSNYDFRTNTYILAVKKILEAERLRGRV